MPLKIEDYAMIGDCRTAALVGRDGSIDWLCVPRFDSGSCFAALLGSPEHGRWKLAPDEKKVEIKKVERRYRAGSMVLETDFTTSAGAVRVVDAMAMDSDTPTVARVVEGLHGEVPVRSELVIRFDYGWIVPWVTHHARGSAAIAGPDKLRLRSWVENRGEGYASVADFTVREGQKIPFTLAWHPSTVKAPAGLDAEGVIHDADDYWRTWSKLCSGDPNCQDEAVLRSLMTLKALTYGPTGGIVAAPTMSIPEKIGGVRNWDYRFCWLRDATFTLLSLVNAGYLDEAREWRHWLLRAVAGRPENLQIMYGIAGERRLTEFELDWLPGYEGSKPVRVGNAASGQFQLDVYGEIADALYQAHRHGLSDLDDAWHVSQVILNFLDHAWHEPDEGIWEVRGERRHFTHSKVMAWVAFDRGVKAIEQFGYPSDDLEKWKRARDDVHREVCAKGFDPKLNSFVQSYGSPHLDASLLMIPLVGFLPADDPRMVGTVAAIEKRLMRDGFLQRYDSDAAVDGLPEGEGAFLPCTFWLADNLALQGRRDEAGELHQRLLDIRNDVGLLAEEYDPIARRQLGNFPQAFSHVCLVNTARNLANGVHGPSQQRHKEVGPLGQT
ncbi:MAG: glycoside hydrolase family 15 protein [Isosphaeraceae bacterium]